MTSTRSASVCIAQAFCSALLLGYLATAAAQATLIGPAANRSPAQRAATPPATPPPAPATAPPATPGSAADQRGIIIVGGAPQSAGATAAAKPTTMKTPSRPKTWDSDAATVTVAAGAGGTSSTLGMRQPTIIGGTGMNSTRSAVPGDVRRNSRDARLVQAAPGNAAAAAEIDCVTPAPRIANIQGKLIPGKPFTINGSCFGDEAGVVELIGLQGGKMTTQFSSWDAHSIKAVMPAVRGTPDQPVAVTVVRKSDRKSSAALEAPFVATRELVDVPKSSWAPSDRHQEFHPTPPAADSIVVSFTARINPACALDSVTANASRGIIKAMNGWQAPGWEKHPHEATVAIPVAYVCKTKTERSYMFNKEIVDSVDTIDCEVDVVVTATAYCPVGVNLNMGGQ